jgi:GNAT superfamily N-acetyltransferase
VHYDIDDNPDRVDVDVVWQFMSTQAYWGRWRDRAMVERQLDGAWRVVGAYRGGTMIGFARAVSDGVGLAYLADVFVVDEARGEGVGAALVKAMIDDGPGAEFRWMLHTADAHDLYRRFGFAEPDPTYLERPGKHAPVSEA